MTDFLVRRDDLRRVRWHEAGTTVLQAGHARLRVESFALTANNVTYAAFGEAMRYWDFFPTEVAGHGRVPVWGFASVMDPGTSGLEPGSRVYGYLPVSEAFDIVPERISDTGFIDGAAHRRDLAAVYNTYLFTAADPSYEAGHEAQQMLLRPLFTTGWMIDDCLMESGSQVPDTVVISSASAKTALALAHCLSLRSGVEAIALTSRENQAFVEGTGLYARTLTYEEASQLHVRGLAAYVDFLGRPGLTAEIHHGLRDRLIRSLVIGATDWQSPRIPVETPGPAPEFFFVPTYAANRARQIGPEALNARTLSALKRFYAASSTYLTPLRRNGTRAIEEAWLSALEGTVPPSTGIILGFRD